ncbi:type 1 glutamine amidotransferase [Aspergillus saccharolyticus JOP 1030-1]|uniref:Class I glutamine amidotransferase n=1 Tax=Aspergillus saccharolyticus JOP 1030-1 TaxID=1450539 RepID=A0A318Z6T7_9EURO|nr:class I glutamine amidotransferase [Aspergillus saccharolyticus JOP 1030-1]PYH42829.1 class I glutamine amidotransferase [Aspergillus saccharolyticus JOP 1030-1]
MAPQLRIAILECDTPVDKINAKYGGYRGVFTRLLQESTVALNQPERLDPETGLDISGWDVVTAQEYPNLEDVDAIVLSGSKHDSFADHPWILKLVDFTRRAYEDPRIKIFAICFGHQILARALGVKVGRNPKGWELAVCEVDLSETGREVFGVDKLRIHQMHQDIAYGYPSEVVSLGSSPTCAVQGMYIPGKMITVQGHPEFREDIMDELIRLRTASGLFSQEMAADAARRAGLAHDGVVITVAFLKLVLGL